MASFDLLLDDATRVPLAGAVTIGRSPACTIVLHDPTVSRRHARIRLRRDGVPLLEDAGSSAGTFVDGRRISGPTRLRDGARIRLGEAELRVERRRAATENRTVVVPLGAESAASRGPRVRPGYALKRLDASEGSRPWILRDLGSGTVRRLSDADAELFAQLDGSHSTAELVGHAERRLGPDGPSRLARLLADLGERGLLVGIEPAAERLEQRTSRLLRPRAWTLPRAGDAIDALLRRGGWVLLTRPFLVAVAALTVAGLAAFAYLVAGRYGTPFVVAQRVGLGAFVFLLGRLAIVAVHELAHGLVLASLGRRVERAGFKLLLIFPYAFVDTSQGWLEPRHRRIAVSAAGPAADLALGALFAVGCLAAPAGAVRDILFQLSFAAYVGACFNLNPFLDRDGYQILVDVLRQPNLRRRAREQFARRLAGQRDAGDSRLLARYSALALAWSVVAAGFVVLMTLRYRAPLAAVAPAGWVAWAVLGSVWVIVLVPTAIALSAPLRARRARA